MVILIVNLHVKRERLDAFQQATRENAQNSIKEPGVLRFDVLQQTEDPTRFVLYEVYRDNDAPAQHRETAHYKAWVAKVPDMLVEPRIRTFYTNFCPADAEW
ncbi:MAG TPA: antibiotic biosynthesis monooxygenase [Bryobacteraceae bacterium]|nr:antibiotic biosynthesis monooxygenase [Bryobacteraceae bacterium]